MTSFTTARRARRPAHGSRFTSLALGLATALARAASAQAATPVSYAPPPPTAAPTTAATAAPSSAEAVDVITLRDGTILRGHVTEIHPGRDTTIVLLHGVARVVAAGDIASATGPAYPTSAAPTTALPGLTIGGAPDPLAVPAAVNPDEYLRPGPERVPVQVDSLGPRQLVGVYPASYAYRGYGYSPHRDLCFTPCTLYVRPGLFQLHSGGEGMEPASRTIEVPATGAAVRLHARTSSLDAGIVTLEVLGVVGLVTAGIVALLGGIFELERSTPEGRDLFNAGLIGTGVSAGLLTAGIVLAVANPAGVASVTPLPAGTVRVGLAPHADGALGLLRLSF